MSSDPLDGDRADSVDIEFPVKEIRIASLEHQQAVTALCELLRSLRIDYAFVGEVALSAWLGRPVESGSVDVLVLVGHDRSRQLPMMAANRGFRVEETEVESAAELDLIPMAHGDVRVHLLLATNALYAKMVVASVPALMAGDEVRVLDAEDMALLLMLSDGPEAAARLQELIVMAGDSFEVDRFNRRLVSIGLGGKLVSR